MIPQTQQLFSNISLWQIFKTLCWCNNIFQLLKHFLFFATNLSSMVLLIMIKTGQLWNAPSYSQLKMLHLSSKACLFLRSIYYMFLTLLQGVKCTDNMVSKSLDNIVGNLWQARQESSGSSMGNQVSFFIIHFCNSHSGCVFWKVNACLRIHLHGQKLWKTL